MSKIYVLDAAGYLYRSYFAIRNITNAKGESTNALFGFIRSVLKLIKDFNPEYLVAVFDGPHNVKAREALYADYKAHRAEMPADLAYQMGWAQQYCDLMGIAKLVIPEVEADDTMGSIAKWAIQDIGATVYLCTSDKDFCQLVNNHTFILNTHKENLIIDEIEVKNIHGVPPSQMIDLLAMTGDASDNVPGLSGFGPKTASMMLNQFGSLDYILEHPEVVSGKKRETVIEEKDKALLSRKLVTIDTNIDIPRDLDFYKYKTTDIEKLKEFFASMNFNSLIKELEQGLPHEKPLKTMAEGETVSYQLVDDEESFKELIKYLLVQ